MTALAAAAQEYLTATEDYLFEVWFGDRTRTNWPVFARFLRARSALHREIVQETGRTDPLAPGLVNVHPPTACEGRGCSVHHPSDHHMKDWPKRWRPEHGYYERQCPHGVGHPDPDDMAYRKSAGLPRDGIHGCCQEGCCRPPQEDHS